MYKVLSLVQFWNPVCFSARQIFLQKRPTRLIEFCLFLTIFVVNTSLFHHQYYICLWKKEHACLFYSTDLKSRMYSPIFNKRLWIYDILCGNPQTSFTRLITSQVSLLNLEKICPPHSKKAYPTQIEKGERIYWGSISPISPFFSPSNTYTRNRTLYNYTYPPDPMYTSSH